MRDAASTERRWDLSQIFAGEESWDEERQALACAIDEFSTLRGSLARSPEALLLALGTCFDTLARIDQLQTYAKLHEDEDLRRPVPRRMRQDAEALRAEWKAAAAWIEPELLAIDPVRIAEFVEREPRLRRFTRYLERLHKRRAHTLDSTGERLMGHAALIRGDGRSIAALLQSAEIDWPEIELGGGERVRLDPSGYARHRGRSSRADREAVFEAFHRALRAFRGSLGNALYATVKEHVFEARCRRYESCLEAALSPNEVQPAVYRMLIEEVNAALPVLHRYLGLRGRLLGIEDLRYHDIYPPLTEKIHFDFSWESARSLVLDALAPLGAEYVSRLERALGSGWVDVDARPGKQSGAYVHDGAHSVHPFMLLNHTPDFHGASTIAHESGHLMHSWLSHEAREYPDCEYVIFVAEVASIVNEMLLLAHLLEQATDSRTRLALLGHQLESARGTLFRQTMFAEFELAIHEDVERGRSLTGENLSERYLELLRRYHGAERGLMRIDELYSSEWAFVPHFHYDFYVYQYATSFVAATTLAGRILAGDEAATARYLEFLRAGSTHPPLDLLRAAGVDMTSAEPFRLTVRAMNGVMDRIDALLEQEPDLLEAQ